MSAYVCSAHHIGTLANAAAAGDPDRAAHLAALWARENVASVNHRYPAHAWDDGERDAFVGECEQVARVRALLTPIQAVKLAHCLDYQSCEHPEWTDSVARQHLERAVREFTRHLAGYARAA